MKEMKTGPKRQTPNGRANVRSARQRHAIRIRRSGTAPDTHGTQYDCDSIEYRTIQRSSNHGSKLQAQAFNLFSCVTHSHPPYRPRPIPSQYSDDDE
jgi:hypothetical protein